MKPIHAYVSLAVLVAVLALAGTVVSQPAPRVPRAFTKHGEPKLPPADPLPSGREIAVKLKSPDNHRERAIANLLKVHVPPKTRADSFKQTFDRERLRVWSWQVEIIAIEEVDGVEHVTVYAQPVVSKLDGQAASLTGAVKEVYEVKNNSLNFIRAETIGFPPALFLD